MEYEQQIQIERPVDEVYRFMDDTAREPEWQTGLLEATQHPPGPTEVGTRKRYRSAFMGKDIVNVWVAQTVDPGRKVVYETTRDSTLRATMTLTWDDTDGGTRVRMAVDGKVGGVFRFVPDAVLEAAGRKELEAAFGLLKRTLES